LALSSFLAFTACKKGETKEATTEKTENKPSEELVVDSVKVSDSTKITDSLKVTYTSKLLVFPSLKIKSYWIAFTFRTIKSKTSLRLGFRLFWTRKK
jgi:uncharacterized protein YaaW (UPF0174 family)